MKPVYWLLLGLVLTILLVVGSAYGGYRYGKSHAELDTAKQWLKSAETAKKIQDKRQEGVNDALRQQNSDLQTINNRLSADIKQLQQRPNRTTARPSCEGANGPELAREYAGFLTRYATEAAKQDAALKACYSAIDSIHNN